MKSFKIKNGSNVGYTSAEIASITAEFTASDKGTILYNTETNEQSVWNGSSLNTIKQSGLVGVFAFNSNTTGAPSQGEFEAIDGGGTKLFFINFIDKSGSDTELLYDLVTEGNYVLALQSLSNPNSKATFFIDTSPQFGPGVTTLSTYLQFESDEFAFNAGELFEISYNVGFMIDPNNFVQEAPLNGVKYLRQTGAWVPLPSFPTLKKVTIPMPYISGGSNSLGHLSYDLSSSGLILTLPILITFNKPFYVAQNTGWVALFILDNAEFEPIELVQNTSPAFAGSNGSLNFSQSILLSPTITDVSDLLLVMEKDSFFTSGDSGYEMILWQYQGLTIT